MKDRAVTFLLAIAALAIFYALFAPKKDVDQEQTSRPLTTEAGPNGYGAVSTWLGNEGIDVESFQLRFQALLADADSRDTVGNLLITTLPHRLALRDGEVAALGQWVRRGNTLLVMAALTDTPEWSMGSQYDPRLRETLTALTGLDFFVQPELASEPALTEAGSGTGLESGAASGTQRLAQPLTRQFVASGRHPLLAGVTTLQSVSEFPASDWDATPVAAGIAITLARTADTQVPSLWLTQSGAGRIIVSSVASPFTNKVIGEADNARLLANLLRWYVEPGGKVLFDDSHQGLVAFYDPGAFFGDPRLHRTLLWIGLVWLVFVLGSQRLRALRTAWNPPDVTDFVRTMGGFLDRVLLPAAPAQRIFENYFNTLRRRLGMSENGEPVWSWLHSHGRVRQADLAELQQLYEHASRSRRIDLVRLHNLIHSTLEEMA